MNTKAHNYVYAKLYSLYIFIFRLAKIHTLVFFAIPRFLILLKFRIKKIYYK